MSEAPEARQRLSDRINDKQRAVTAYLARERPRRNRLSNVSIVGSGLAAALTAGPAVGGTGFTHATAGLLSLSEDSIVWRVLCLLAVIFSVAAALSTNLATSRSVADRVSAAETCSAQLESLAVSLDVGHIDVDDAVKLYQQYAGQVAFVDAAPR